MEQYEIPQIQLNEVTRLGVYIDGADEINHMMQMIKGGGAALLPEKIVATLSDQFICIADESKYVRKLGQVSPTGGSDSDGAFHGGGAKS